MIVTVAIGSAFGLSAKEVARRLKSPCYTTRWADLPVATSGESHKPVG